METVNKFSSAADENADRVILPSPSPASYMLWKYGSNNNAFTCPDDIFASWLSWKDLFVKDVSSRGKPILEGVTGYAEPSYMLAIMGPSGSGKSTLLSALAGRLPRNLIYSGQVLLNSRSQPLSSRTAAYVAQDDTLIGPLTVRETIYYSAQIRLPDKMSAQEKSEIVERTIMEMGLQECKNTPVGNWHLRGISGGEKRRLSLAVEILMRPRLLFLDEPTSGLDSASAYFVTQTLRNLSRQGRTVIASVHQPASDVFALFDRLCLLSAGNTVYFGDSDACCEFFAECGFACPPLRNPADHFMRCVNSDFDKVKASLHNSQTQNGAVNNYLTDVLSTAEIVNALKIHYCGSNYSARALTRVQEISQIKGSVLNTFGCQASFFSQTSGLTKRSFTNMKRDIGYYWFRVLLYAVIAVCVGTVYFHLQTSYQDMTARGLCASFVLDFVTFMSLSAFPSFAEEMKVFQRERRNGHYTVMAFVISNLLSSLPFQALIATISGTITYYMVGLHPGLNHHLYFVLDVFLCMAVVESLLMTVAATVPNFLMGIVTSAAILGAYLLVSASFRPLNEMPKPVWRYPLYYMSFDPWSLQGQYKNDFIGLHFEPQEPGMPKIKGEDVVKQQLGINTRFSKWWDLCVILSMFLIYRSIFVLIIKYKECIVRTISGILRSLRQKMEDLASWTPSC